MNDPRALGRLIFWIMFTALMIYLGIKYGWKGNLLDLIFDIIDRKKKK